MTAPTAPVATSTASGSAVPEASTRVATASALHSPRLARCRDSSPSSLAPLSFGQEYNPRVTNGDRLASLTWHDAKERRMKTRGMMQSIAWAVAALVALPVIAYLALLAINWNDEPPSADAAQLVAMKRDRPPLANAANGYIHALGIAATADVDPVALGSARNAYIETFVSTSAPDGYPALPGRNAEYRAARSPAVVALAAACGDDFPACAEALDADPGALAQWLASEQWLLDRYRRMLATVAWREAIPGDANTPLAGYQHVLEGQKLHLLAASQPAQARDPAAVRDLLERDLVFWREVLASSDLLVSKMVAVAAVRRNFAFGNLALRELPQDLANAAVPRSWRQPLTLAERSLARPLGGEWQVIGAALRMAMSPEAQAGASGELAERLQRPLFQEQATLNLFAARMVHLGAMSELPYLEVGQALERLPEPEEGGMQWLRPYNLVGVVLASVAPPTYANYIARTSDLEGERRAVLLAANLRGAGIQRDDMAAAVRDASLRSPYDEAPFEWDADGRAVVFRGLGSRVSTRHAAWHVAVH
ncbi:hypothetical protein [Luteimonas sp. A501]